MAKTPKFPKKFDKSAKDAKSTGLTKIEPEILDEDFDFDDEFGNEESYAIPYTSKGLFAGKKQYTYGSSSGLWGKGSWSGLSDYWRSPWRSQKDDDPRQRAAKGRKLSGVDSILMAKHLRDVRSTCYLVFSRRKIDIRWASEDVSFTDIEGGHIRVSPAPLLTTDKAYDKWTTAQRLDVVHGLALHEAAHNAHTPSMSKTHCMNRGGMMFAELFNIFEDVYIEHQVEEEFPGFADYFDSKDDYYFTHTDMNTRIQALMDEDLSMAGDFPKKTDADYEERIQEQISKLGKIINVLIPYIRHRGEKLDDLKLVSERHQQAAEVIERAKENGDLLRKENLSIDDRIQVTQDTYIDLVSMFKNLPREEIEKNMKDAMGDFEKSGFGKLLEKIFRENGVDASSGNTELKKGGDTPVGAADAEEDTGGRSRKVRQDVISSELEGQIEAVIEADLRDMEVEKFESGYAGEFIDKVAVLDMKRLPYADARYAQISKESNRHTRRLMNTLKFRSEDRVYKEREREYGRIDATRITNLKAFKSPDVFYRTIKAEAPKVHIGILVDESGSMRAGSDWGMTTRKRKMDIAVTTAIMMANALKQVPSTTYEIWGHSGDMHSGNREITGIEEECNSPIRGGRFNGPAVFRYLDSRAGMTDARVLGRIAGRGNNYDGPALEAVGMHMVQNAPKDRKVLFVICDGMPAGSGYGGEEASEDVRQRNKKLGKHGVEVISIFVGGLGGAQHQMEIMYGKQNKGWIHCPNSDDLPMLVEKIATRLLKWDGA